MNRARRWLLRTISLLALLACAAALAAWLALRGSLPALEGERRLPGLSHPATVTRDALGVVTVDVADGSDAARALGYVHAQERFFEMDLMRRVAAGELAAVFGQAALETDRRHRLHRFRARVRAELDAATGDELALLDAYAAGVNAGLADRRARPWPYLLLRQSPAPWLPEDSLLVALSMYLDLQGGTNESELARWRMEQHLPPALRALLDHDGSRWDAPLQGDPRGDAALPDASLVDLRRLPAPGRPGDPTLDEPTTPGSNNFAVAGALTADGRAILANDMHLGLRAPNLWFRARLRYPDAAAPGGRADVQGFTLPGLPAVIVGSNGHVAWGYTNSYTDQMDWQLVTPCRQDAAPSGCTPVRRHVETIAVAGQASQQLEVEETAWGPLAEHNGDGTALALRWTAHLPGAVNLGLLELARAADLDQALASADRTAVPAQNLLLVDRHGAIAWRILGPLPERADACLAHEPEPATPDTCPPWSLSTGKSPVLRSPELVRAWTANARVVDGQWLSRLGDGGYALATRAWQIQRLLPTAGTVDESDLLAIQLDDRSPLMAQWSQLLHERAANAGDSSALAALSAAMAGPANRATTDSVAYRIARAWRNAVHARIADGLTAPARAALGDDFVMPDLPQLEGVAWPLVNERPQHLLPRSFESWDALFEDAAREVRDRLQQTGPLQARSWGETNRAHICHPLAAALPSLLGRRLCMPDDPLPGGHDTVRVQAPAFGASQRMVVAPGHEAQGIIHMPGGQSGHPLSPFWGAGHDDWVQGRPSPFLPGPARYTLQLTPAGPR